MLLEAKKYLGAIPPFEAEKVAIDALKQYLHAALPQLVHAALHRGNQSVLHLEMKIFAGSYRGELQEIRLSNGVES